MNCQLPDKSYRCQIYLLPLYNSIFIESTIKVYCDMTAVTPYKPENVSSFVDVYDISFRGIGNKKGHKRKRPLSLY